MRTYQRGFKYVAGARYFMTAIQKQIKIIFLPSLLTLFSLACSDHSVIKAPPIAEIAPIKDNNEPPTLPPINIPPANKNTADVQRANMTVDWATLSRLPYFLNSSAGEVMVTSNKNKYIHFDDTNGATKVIKDDIFSTSWQQIIDLGDYADAPMGGFGSVVEDPANPLVFYACAGSESTSDSSIDSQTDFDRLGLFRSTDEANSFVNISKTKTSTILNVPGYGDVDETNNQVLSRYILGCPSRIYSRFIYDQKANIEMYIRGARNEHMMAFDPRTTITINGKKMSQTVYAISPLFGVFRGTYNNDGKLTWINVDESVQDEFESWPSFYDDGLVAARSNTIDFASYDYKPQTNDNASATDYRSCYPYDTTLKTCNYQWKGRTLVGTIDRTCPASARCRETETHRVHTAIVTDPISISSQYNQTADQNLIMYKGAMTNDLWPNGGFWRGEETGDETHPIDWTEFMDGTIHLDVRDIAIDASQTITLDSGQTVAKYVYIAAGDNGFYIGTTSSDGKFSIKSYNDYLYPRTQFDADYVATGSYDTNHCTVPDRCGQYQNVNVATIDGTTYILVIDMTGFYVASFTAKDGPPSPLSFARLQLKAPYSTRDGALSDSEQEIFDTTHFSSTTEGGAIDPFRKSIVIPSEERIYTLNLSDLTTAEYTLASGLKSGSITKTYLFGSGKFHAIHAGFGDRGGQPLITKDGTVHISRLDGGYAVFGFDQTLKQTFITQTHSVEDGFCPKTFFVPDTASEPDISKYDLDHDQKIDSAFSAYFDGKTTIPDFVSARSAIYGGNIVSGIDSKTGEEFFYHGASSGSTVDDGSIHKAHYNKDTKSWQLSLATGDKTCQAYYPYNNGAKNSCVYLCDAEDSSIAALPTDRSYSLITIDPHNSDNVWTIGSQNSTTPYLLYHSIDGGMHWTLETYVDSSGTSLSTSSHVPVAMLVDPINPEVIYITYSESGVYKRQMNKSGKYYFENISYAIGDDNSFSQTLSLKNTTDLPVIYDIEAVKEGAHTRLYIAVDPFCDAGSGIFPESICQTPDGGTVFSLLVGVDTQWKRMFDSPLFGAVDIAISPLNPNYIVVAGSSNFLNYSGNLENSQGGLMVSKDAGATWAHVTSDPLNVLAIGASNQKASQFAMWLKAGMWLLDIDQ